MANVDFTAASGSVKNVFTQDVDLVMIGPITFATTGDTVTVTDLKNVLWAVPCVLSCAGTGNDMYAGTASVDVSTDLGIIKINSYGGSAGTAYVLAAIERETS